MYKSKYASKGLSLIELLVVISIIGLLSTILYASFDESRQQARDKARLAALKELQLAVEQYRAQNGRYPERGTTCNNAGSGGPLAASQFVGPRLPPGPDDHTGDSLPDGSEPGLFSCHTTLQPYINNLVPVFISALPTDRQFENELNRGFYYWTNPERTAYKLMLRDVVESLIVEDDANPFARCASSCSVAIDAHCDPNRESYQRTYAVYSPGAECQ